MRLEGKVALITGAATGVKGALMGFAGASDESSLVTGSELLIDGGLSAQ
jgi:NAD(P)-dependent dehydrogenase (short-subunit alcohol dehydrogenase family)